MTSERAGEQISKELSSDFVKAASTLGGHDLLNEAPRYRTRELNKSDRIVFQEWNKPDFCYLQRRTWWIFWKTITVGIRSDLEDFILRDGQPG